MEGVPLFLEEASYQIDPKEIAAVLDEIERSREIVLRRFWLSHKPSLQEASRFFREEAVSKLSLEEYILLLRRFPSTMSTHVIRRGVRDHTGHMFHGLGLDEFSSEFEGLLADQRLLPPLKARIKTEGLEVVAKRAIQYKYAKSRAEALENLDEYVGQTGDHVGKYGDASAVHFAVEFVGDLYYGSETRNEVFVVIPSILIATQYHFSHDPGYCSEKGKNNDLWVWANDNTGIPLDVGIVFLPGNAQVDPETGSRYALREDKTPIIDEAAIETLLSLANQTSGEEWGDRRNREGQERILDRAEIFDPHLRTALLRGNMWSFLREGYDERVYDSKEAEQRDNAKGILRRAGLLFCPAQQSVPSREYWESYFARHPQHRPSKMVYYDAQKGPSEALEDWKKEHSLWRSSQQHCLGFPERMTGSFSEQALTGSQAFRDEALKIVDKVFPIHP